MTKIAIIGAGSTVFAKNLIGDILSFPELCEVTLGLHDIDEERLRTTEVVTRRLGETLGAHPSLQASTDRQAVLDGADYVISMFQVGGYHPATVVDFEVPKKYGLRQTIGDTVGIGGIFRGLRTIPVLIDLCTEMERLCPDTTFLNYVNPMAILCWAAARASRIRTVGLCHSVQGTAAQLAQFLGVDMEEVNYLCAGINHMAFYLKYERRLGDGRREDLYPRLRRTVTEGRAPDGDRVRYEVFKRLGYFVTESSEHFSEYVPWFIKCDRPDLIGKFNIPLDEYLRRCELQAQGWRVLQHKVADPSFDAVTPLRQMLQAAGLPDEMVEHVLATMANLDGHTLSGEYGARIIHSMETGTPRVVYGNVPNRGLIDNLPAECIVEVPCLVDGNGVQPTRIGALPPHLAALIQTNINVQALTVEAGLTLRREHIVQAALLDPHTAAELDMEQIEALVDDMITAHGDWLPDYS